MVTMTTGDRSARTRKNTANLFYWTAAWVVSLAVAVFGPLLIWESRALSLGAILLNVAMGIGMIAANKRHLDGLDELQRKIQMDAMAFALGVGLVAGLAYSTLDVTDVIAGDAEISFLVILISIAYIGGIVLGRRKYR